MAPEGVSAGGAALRGCPGNGVWASGESNVKGRVPTGPGKEWDPLALAGTVRDSLSADARPGATASRCAEGHWAASLAPKGATNSRSRWHRFSLGCFCEVRGPREQGKAQAPVGMAAWQSLFFSWDLPAFGAVPLPNASLNVRLELRKPSFQSSKN